MKTLVVFFVLSFGSVAAAEWTKTSVADQKTYSEEWPTGECNVKVLAPGDGVSVEHRAFLRWPSDMLIELFETVRITKTEKGIDMHVEWVGGPPFLEDRGPTPYARDIFLTDCRDAAQSLPTKVKEKFHHLYGIEP